jgi:hypothetical protein
VNRAMMTRWADELMARWQEHDEHALKRFSLQPTRVGVECRSLEGRSVNFDWDRVSKDA